MSPVRLLCTANQRVRKRAGVSILVQVLPGGSDLFRRLPMFPHAFQYFQMFSDAFPMPFRCPGRRGTSKQVHFEGLLFPFRCLSDVFPIPFRCVSDAFDGISDVCGALSDVSNVVLFSLNVRCFSCFECLSVKICKGRDAMFSNDTGAGFISEKTVGFLRFFAKSWNSFFSA